MWNHRVLEALSIVLLSLAVGSLLFASFIGALPFGFMFTMQVTVIVVALCAAYSCRRVRGLTKEDNFWPAFLLLPRRLRYALSVSAALGVTPLIIVCVGAMGSKGCGSILKSLVQSCDVSWREEGGAYFRQVNGQPPLQISKREYELADRAAGVVFSGMWITFLSVSIGMTVAARQLPTVMDANNALERERGR